MEQHASQARPPPERYEYTPLPDPNTHIRLLELFPVEDELELISGELLDVALADAPPFVAFSYTWGSETPVIPILLHVKLFAIHENLYSFLWHYVRTGRRDRLWIDALTIKQRDTYEKGQRVNLMRHIFESADIVVIWLSHPCGWDYFSRLFVVQEFTLARRLMVQCGTRWVDWELSRGWRQRRNAPLNDHLAAFMRSGSRSQQATVDALIEQREMWQRNRSQQPGTHLLDLVASHRERHCKDVRDRVYGLIGLANNDISHIKPDYQISAIDLFFQILEAENALVMNNCCRSWQPLWQALELGKFELLNDAYLSRPRSKGKMIFMHAHGDVKIHQTIPRHNMGRGILEGETGAQSLEYLVLPPQKDHGQLHSHPVQVVVPAEAEVKGALYHLGYPLGFILKDSLVQDDTLRKAETVPTAKDLQELATGALAVRIPSSLEGMLKTTEEVTVWQKITLSATRIYDCFDLNGLHVMDTSPVPCATNGQPCIVVSMTRAKFARCRLASLHFRASSKSDKEHHNQ